MVCRVPTVATVDVQIETLSGEVIKLSDIMDEVSQPCTWDSNYWHSGQLSHQLLTLRTSRPPTIDTLDHSCSYLMINVYHQVGSRCRRVIQLSFHILLAFCFTHYVFCFGRNLTAFAGKCKTNAFLPLISFSCFSTYHLQSPRRRRSMLPTSVLRGRLTLLEPN